jgi:hypothetical protein
MDVLNDYYPLYPENPDTAGLSESELSENQEHIETLERLNGGRKRKKPLHFDDFCLVHSDTLWYLWCMINEFTQTHCSPLLNRMDYPKFCSVCYDNSTKT